MTERKPYAITVQDLVTRGRDDIPAELVTSTHLIYNSPAALAFNSPGAQGFGVKRAGLSIPGSVMLLVGPGCCGRNTTNGLPTASGNKSCAPKTSAHNKQPA